MRFQVTCQNGVAILEHRDKIVKKFEMFSDFCAPKLFDLTVFTTMPFILFYT